MKRFIIAILIFAFLPTIQAQISVLKKEERTEICSGGMGYRKHKLAVIHKSNGDLVYVIQIPIDARQNYDLMLGSKDEAITLLKSMLEYEQSGDYFIFLNNPTQNMAKYKRSWGQLLFNIYDRDSDYKGFLTKSMLKNFLKGIEKDEGK